MSARHTQHPFAEAPERDPDQWEFPEEDPLDPDELPAEYEESEPELPEHEQEPVTVP